MTDPRMTPTNDAPVTVERLKPQYPDYLDDPDGLARFRQDVRQTPGHDMAKVNHNSLGRLIDTIERLRSERDRLAALASAPAAGSREAAMVTLRTDGEGRPKVWCDPEIAGLVDALNTESLSTVASCSGHGHRPGIIMLTDGRCLMVFRDREYAKAAEAAYPLDINGVASAPAGDGVEEKSRSIYADCPDHGMFARIAPCCHLAAAALARPHSAVIATGDRAEPMAHLGEQWTIKAVQAEMLAVATASLDDDSPLIEEWPLDCRADVDRWQCVIGLALARPRAAVDRAQYWTDLLSDGLGADRAGCWRCGAISKALDAILTLEGYTTAIVQGSANGVPHVWVEADGVIYDATAGQFNAPIQYSANDSPRAAVGEREA